MCGHFFDHGVGKIIAKVAPIAAAFIPGVGPLASAALTAGVGALSSKLQGGSWGDALKGGALSGIGALAAPVAGNLFSSAFPETAGSLGINGGYNTAFGQGFGGAASSGLAPIGEELAQGFGANAPSLYTGFGQAGADVPGALEQSFADPAVADWSGSSAYSPDSSNAPSTGLSAIGDKIKAKPLEALSAALTIGNSLQPTGTQTQSDILKKQQADEAKQAQFSADTIRMLNSAQTGRAPVTPSISDYYTYGQRPEQLYFNRVNSPITY